MITKEQLQAFREWFAEYTKDFIQHEGNEGKMQALKAEHSLRVATEIKQVGRGIHLENGHLRLAETIALFHDIGRFEQFKQYQTFSDKQSVDHADLGVKILREKKVLEKLDEKTIEIIEKSISFHNKKDIPANESEEIIFYTRLLRDADKLDIYRVVTDYYHQDPEERDSTVGLGLPDSEEVTEKVIQDILERRICELSDMKSINDFKLLQISWIFDINFKRTFQIIRERRYLSMIYTTLPETVPVEDIRKGIRAYIDEKCIIDEFHLPDSFIH